MSRMFINSLRSPLIFECDLTLCDVSSVLDQSGGFILAGIN